MGGVALGLLWEGPDGKAENTISVVRSWRRLGNPCGAFGRPPSRIRAALAARIREYWFFNQTTGMIYNIYYM